MILLEAAEVQRGNRKRYREHNGGFQREKGLRWTKWIWWWVVTRLIMMTTLYRIQISNYYVVHMKLKLHINFTSINKRKYYRFGSIYSHLSEMQVLPSHANTWPLEVQGPPSTQNASELWATKRGHLCGIAGCGQSRVVSPLLDYCRPSGWWLVIFTGWQWQR